MENPNLTAKDSRGPLGLGDPNDRILRKVESEILIPKKMRDKAKELKCGKEVQKFSECCANSGFSMVFSCRAENSILKDCLSRWYADEDFKNMCKEEYLAERAEYRKTGITQKMKKVPTSF